VDAVLIAVADVADVDLGGDEIEDVACRLAVLEEQVAEGSVGKGGGEVVLRCHRHGLDGHAAGGSAVSEQDFLSTADKFAVDEGVANVEADGLQTPGVGEELEVGGVAVLEDDGDGLLGVGDRGESCVGGGVVDAGEAEVNCGDLAHGAVDGEGAAGARHLVQNAVDVVVDGAAAEGGADGRVGDAGGGNDSLAQAAGEKGLAVAGSGAGGAGAGELDAEGAFNAGVGQQLLGSTQVGTDQFATDTVTLQRSDAQIPHQNGVGAGWSRIRSVGRFRFQQNQTLASKKGHWRVPLGGQGEGSAG